jgi:hypothetical protein
MNSKKIAYEKSSLKNIETKKADKICEIYFLSKEEKKTKIMSKC